MPDCHDWLILFLPFAERFSECLKLNVKFAILSTAQMRCMLVYYASSMPAGCCTVLSEPSVG